MTARDRLRAKIAALLAKTEASGCTEAEAMAAAAMAARLMAEHAFDQSEIEMTEATVQHKWQRSPWRDKLSAGISVVTNCDWIIRPDAGDVLFIGREPGPDIAAYLRDICFRAVDRAVREFKEAPFYLRRRKLATRRAAVADFVDGMVTRLITRMFEVFRPVISKPARDEAKQALAHRFKGMLMTKPIPQRERRFSEAGSAGWRAGADVGLHHGVAGAASRLAIEDRS
jgi:hypothetical protein